MGYFAPKRGERASVQIGERCKSSCDSPILNRFLLLTLLLKDAVDKRYIVANAGSNPAPDHSGFSLIAFSSFKNIKQCRM